MSKTPKNVPAQAGKSNVPAPAQAAALPAFMADKVKADAGKGTSQSQEDNLVPLIYILQAQSPQVQPRNPEYIEGAEGGDIWLRNSANPIVKGEEGFLFQPCFFSKDWVEWKPNRGGYAGRHDLRPADAKEQPDPQNKNKKIWVRENGNIVQETRYHIGYVIKGDGVVLPYVIPMTGSGHTVSRAWMFSMNSKTIPGVEGAAPSWACLYRLKTKFTSNDQGDWFKFEVEDAGWIESEADYARGEKLYNGFAQGERKIEQPQDEAPGGDNEKM